MGQEFFINSQELEDKIRQLLPSQGGRGAGFDLSASTQIIPIIDLTESAEGSNVRADLQTALSHGSQTTFSVNNATTTVLNNTGYWRFFGVAQVLKLDVATNINITLNDGTTSKSIFFFTGASGATATSSMINFDFMVFVPAGHSVIISTSSSLNSVNGSYRQIANIDGELVNPI